MCARDPIVGAGERADNLFVVDHGKAERCLSDSTRTHDDHSCSEIWAEWFRDSLHEVTNVLVTSMEDCRRPRSQCIHREGAAHQVSNQML